MLKTLWPDQRLLSGCLIVVGTLLSPDITRGDITVAGLDRNLPFAFSAGSYMQPARDSLLNSANFGPGGIVGESVVFYRTL